MASDGSVKAFLTRWGGKIGLTALASLVTGGAFYEALAAGSSTWLLIAIVLFVVLLLAVPIFLKWRRPRELAVAALAAMIVIAPVTGILYTEEIRAPVAPLSSPSQNGGTVLANAQVSPHLGVAGETYHFQVTVNRQYLPSDAHAPEYLVLYLSTCPGAETANSSSCGGGGYAFWALNYTFNATGTNSTVVDLAKTLNSANVWWWLAGFAYEVTNVTDNRTTNSTDWVWVGAGGAIYLIPGPVSEDFGATFSSALPTLYGTVILYFGLVYYSALVIYMWLKSRESRRNPPVAGTPLPGGAGPLGSSAGPPGRPSIERSCPTCGAVVYPEEKACWKCGATLSFPPTSPGDTGTRRTPPGGPSS